MKPFSCTCMIQSYEDANGVLEGYLLIVSGVSSMGTYSRMCSSKINNSNEVEGFLGSFDLETTLFQAEGLAESVDEKGRPDCGFMVKVDTLIPLQ